MFWHRKKARHTEKKSTESPWAQSWVVIDVKNMSQNIFGIVKDSSLSEMIFLGSIEERGFVRSISDFWRDVVGLLGIES